jgi:4-hydroxybenzoate polyprenyltransferase
MQASTAFVLFCLISSSVYLLNDIRDREQDRVHPEKRKRPLAAGDITVKTALGMMTMLLLLAVAGGAILNNKLALVLFVYWLVNLLYSALLKNQVILDVFSIAVGFLLRVVGGAVAISVEISHWLVICSTLLALFLGFCKRRHELVLLGQNGADHRRVLVHYSVAFLDMMIAIVTASTVMSYALYTVSEETILRFATDKLLLTMPFVLYGIFRYLYLVYHENRGGDPTQLILSDMPIVINLFLWAATAGVVIYWY